MSFSDNYFALMEEDKKKKKKKETEKTGHSFTDNFNSIMAEDDIAPVKTTAPLFVNKTAPLYNQSVTIAPTTKAKTTTEKEEKKGRFEGITQPLDDGYDFGEGLQIGLEAIDRILNGHPENRGKVTDTDGDGLRDASWWDATWKSAQRGYYNSRYGEETFRSMLGEGNSADAYKKILEGDEYQFEAEGLGKKAVSGAAEMLGQIVRQSTREKTLGAGLTGAGAGAGFALIAGQAGPQALLPEEALTVPGAAIAGFTSGITAGNAEAALEIEAGHAYNEMIENGVSEKTARNVALAVGGVNAGLELLQIDELFKAFKVLNKTGATEKAATRIAKELMARGVDVVKETAQEVAQEGVTIAGVQAASKKDNGEWAYTKEEVASRMGETAMSSALTFGMLNVPAGVSNVSQIASDNSNTQKLTANEQAVVAKEVENRIAEQEKDGKKLTKKEKAVIEEAVIRDMERGYISTDTIEEVLGGETYKTHKDTIDSEKAMQEEYDMLYQMKNGDKSDAQIDRQAELRQKLEDIKQNFNRNQLQDEVMSLVQNDRLAESYNERYRRGQTFETDISKYDAKQQATIQKAIDSGILNNTNRTHEFVDMIAKITADKGVLFDFTNNERLKESGFAKDGVTVNGFVTKDGVTLNIDSSKAWETVVGHEITHVLEGTEMYTALQSVVTEYAKAKGEYQNRYDALAKLYETVEGADIDAELTADLVGDYLFSDTDFVNHLSVTNRNVFQKIYDEIKYLCKIATAGSKELRELEKVKRTFEQVYREGGKAQTETKYSLADAKLPTLEELKKKDPVTVVDISTPQTKGTFAERRKQILANSGKVISKPYINKDTGAMIFLTEKSYTHAFNNLGDTQLNAVEHLPELIENAVLTHGENATHGSDYASGVYTFFAAAKADGIRPVKLKVKEYTYAGQDLPKNIKAYFDSLPQGYAASYDTVVLEVEEIEKSPSGSAKDMDRIDPFLSPEELSTIKVADLINLVKGDAKKYLPKLSLSDSGGKPTADQDIRYSLSDSEGRELSPSVQNRFGKSKVVDENGSLKVVYHGTATGEFSIFDKSKGSVEGDYGSGFYFTDNEADVTEHYEDGGPDFENKVARLAEQIESEEEIDYEEAEQKAREQLYKGGHKFEVYLNIENPAVVGKTILFDPESYFSQYNEEDYDSYEDYEGEVEQLVADDIDNIIWDIERNVDIYSTDGISEVLWEAMNEGGIGLEELKAKLNNLYLEDSNGNLVANEVARQIIESLGYDGIVDPTVSGKWNMDIEEGTTHYIVFKPNQIKAVTNENPSDNPDIHLSLSRQGEQFAPGKFYGKDMKLEVAPVQETVAENAMTTEAMFPDDQAPFSDDPERFDSLTDEDAPPVRNVEYGEHGNPMTMPKSTVNMIAQNVKSSLAVSDRQMGEVHRLIEDYAKAEFPSRDQLFRELKDKFGTYTEKMNDEAIKDVKNTLRKYRLNVSDAIKSEIADYGQLRRSNFGKVLFSRQGTDVDVAYQELSNLYPGFFPKEITNPTDQLLQIIDVANRSHTFEDSYEIPDEAIWYVVDDIEESVRDYQNIQREKDASRTDNDYLDDLVKHGDAYAGDIAPVPETETPRKTAQQTRRKLAAEVGNLEIEMGNNERLREQSNADFDAEIARLQAEYDALGNKNTIRANDLLRRIERTRRMKNSVDADYARRIQNLGERIEKMSSDTYQTAAQRKVKQQEYTEQMESLVGDTTHWKDKKLGISYKVNTLRRNLRDVVLKADGSRDVEKADAIYEELQGKYNHHEAILNKEAAKIKKPYADMKITKAEDAYIQMLGEFRHNPETTLTEDVVKEFYEKHKGKIDTAKVDRAIEMARKTYDELLVRVNQVLKEQGMKEIPYRKGYFPHFTEEKQSVLAKLFNWKTRNNDIPTDIAGLTENFNPNRSWQSFNKERTSDTTDYSFMKGMDTYVQGALDWVHHIEDIQKNRAFENYLRYVHSEQGVKDKIDAIRQNDEYDAEEMQAQIDLVLAEARNPLNNFVVDLRARTNTLANKKSSMDRGMEEATNRRFYSTMTNISSRVSANMVGGSISSALTNFIPITQSWGQVSPLSSLRAMGETIRSTFRDDGTIDKSDFLTNRLRKADDLYKTGWDKVSDAVGIMMEAVDSFTSQTVWRSKYHENINNGMSESEAIQNADQFAENVLAGRSRGNQPTIFDSKNPLVKTLTAFQLEVANQYGYMLKDMPQDMRNDTNAKLVKGYVTMFLGAYAYNALFSSLTGRDAAFDPIGIIEDLLRDIFGDDEEEKEPTDIVMGFAENIMQDIPFVGGLMGGGRVPISSAMPYDGNVMDILEGGGKLLFEGDTSDLTSEWLKPVYYLALPVGGGQIKKTVQGLSMFSDDHPIAGSYTKGGDLRFPVDDTIGSRVKAAMFGQWSSKNARDYFDNNRAPLKEKQIQEFIDVDIPIRDYWEYREGLSGLDKLSEKADYIAGLDLPISKKNLLINNIADRKEDINLEGYEDFGDFEEFDFAVNNPEQYEIAKKVGGYDAYMKYQDGMKGMKLEEKFDYVAGLNLTDAQKNALINGETDRKEPIDMTGYNTSDYSSFEEFEFSKEHPGRYGVAKVVGGYDAYTDYIEAIGEFDAKDASGRTVSGLKKERVSEYINGLDLDYGQKIILYRSQYDSKADRAAYDADIFEYLNGRDDISYEEKVEIFKKLGFEVSADGYVTW